MIVIQTSAQVEMAKRFSSSGICCDATHGTNGYDFLLITILAPDEFGEGQPIAWCIANHETEEFLSLFFEKVKENIGLVTPAWFMSDIAPQYYNAFCSVNRCGGKL